MTDPACSAVALNLLHVIITHPLVAMTVLVFSRVARMKQLAILISMQVVMTDPANMEGVQILPLAITMHWSFVMMEVVCFLIVLTLRHVITMSLLLADWRNIAFTAQHISTVTEIVTTIPISTVFAMSLRVFHVVIHWLVITISLTLMPLMIFAFTRAVLILSPVIMTIWLYVSILIFVNTVVAMIHWRVIMIHLQTVLMALANIQVALTNSHATLISMRRVMITHAHTLVALT
jgi:hypothetical protein